MNEAHTKNYLITVVFSGYQKQKYPVIMTWIVLGEGKATELTNRII